ncbi:hypothetical protein HYT24_01385 [Candidatus Pacearchaeota archaeon]|nr:hypothetical protein [Candidatus Pacearchaeota archaeon]
MAFQAIIDSAVLMAFFALSIDIIFQIFHILKRKSSKDLSLIGISLRLTASSIFLIKFITVGDLVLITGQAIFVTGFFIYVILLFYYRKK